MPDKSFISKERLYLDADGNVVDENDPNRATLLVGKGGTLSAEQAEKYGLSNLSEAPEPLSVEQNVEEGIRQPGPNDPAEAERIATINAGQDPDADANAGASVTDAKAKSGPAANKARRTADSESK